MPNTDHGSAKANLGPAPTRKDSGASSYIKVDGATALAVLCLAENDPHNLARVCCEGPATVISTLLDDRNIGNGPVFTHRFIWPLIAHEAARVRQQGSLNVPRLEALGNAFANFLAYHQRNQQKNLYPEVMAKLYPLGSTNE